VTGPLRVGLVGCGRIAERGYVPALRRAAGVELVGVADVDGSRCEEVAPGVLAFDSAPALVAGARPDALVVATPPGTHLEVARAAAEHGLPTLVEKPPASDARGARELAALEPAPWVGFNRRFEPALQRLQARVPPSGRLGLTLSFDYFRAAWDAHVLAGDVLDDVGAHLVDLARWLTGSEIVEVRPELLEDGAARLVLELGRGRARIACAGDRPYRELVEVRGERGELIGRHVAGGRAWGLRSRLRARGEDALVLSLSRELEAFAAAARGEPAAPLATALDGLAVMDAIEAVRRSSF
jgi:predicted dehydrogenase